MRTFIISLSIAFCSMIVADYSQAADKYLVGVEDIEYYPQYLYENGEYKGYGKAVLDEFAKSAGIEFEYKAFPVKRLFSRFLAGSVDFKYPDNEYWSADDKKGKGVIYSKPVVSYIDGIMVKAANLGMGKGGIKKLGIVRGFTAWDYLGDIKSGKIKLSENSSFLAMLKMTIAGRVDGAYSNVAVAKYVLENKLEKPGSLVFDPDLPHTKSHYHFSTIKHPEIMKKFNIFLSEKADLVKSLKKKYGVGSVK